MRKMVDGKVVMMTEDEIKERQDEERAEKNKALDRKSNLQEIYAAVIELIDKSNVTASSRARLRKLASATMKRVYKYQVDDSEDL